MLLFRSEEHVDRWRIPRGLERGSTMTIGQQWRLALEWYSDRADPEWPRRTPGAAQAVFQSIGLEGEFWQLS